MSGDLEQRLQDVRLNCLTVSIIFVQTRKWDPTTYSLELKQIAKDQVSGLSARDGGNPPWTAVETKKRKRMIVATRKACGGVCPSRNSRSWGLKTVAWSRNLMVFIFYTTWSRLVHSIPLFMQPVTTIAIKYLKRSFDQELLIRIHCQHGKREPKKELC